MAEQNANPPSGDFDSDQFSTLVAVYLDGEPTTGQIDTLNAVLAESQQARKLFVHLSRIHGLLTERAISRAADPLDSKFDLSTGLPTADGRLSLNESVIVPAIRDNLDDGDSRRPVDMPELISSYRPTTPGPTNRWWIAAAITGLAAVLILAFVFIIQSSKQSSPRVAVQPVPPPVETAPAATQPISAGVAANTASTGQTVPPPTAITPVPPQLVDAIAATWTDPKLALRPNDPIPTGPISLQTGWIKIRFSTGTTAVIEAPARFDVQSDMKVVLKSGRIAAVVPPAGHGFTVEAPLCSVVDLGTDFGVSVDLTGRNEVSVFKGAVELHQGKADPTTIREGAGRRLETANAAPVETRIDAAAFIRTEQFNRWSAAAKSPEQVSATDRWRNFTEQMSRDPSLKLLYAFDGKPSDGLILHNRAVATVGHFDLGPSDHDPVWTDGRLPGMAALDFHPDQTQRLLLPSYPLSQSGSMTVTTWVYARTAVPWGGIAKSWGDSKCGALHLGLSSEQDLEIELDGTRTGGPVAREGESKKFPTGRWVFVAFVTDGKKVTLYRDGQIVAEAPSRPLQADSPMKSLAIGFKTGDDGVEPLETPAVGFWDGMIGDFAMFDRPLSQAEVTRIYEAGQP